MKHKASYYLQKARDAFLEEGNEGAAQDLEDRWGVLVNTRKKR